MAFSNSVRSIVFSALIQSVTYLNRNYFSKFHSGDLARYKWQKHCMGTSLGKCLTGFVTV